MPLSWRSLNPYQSRQKLAHRVLDVLVTEVSLKRAGIVPLWDN
jgi:hypothetical protein